MQPGRIVEWTTCSTTAAESKGCDNSEAARSGGLTDPYTTDAVALEANNVRKLRRSGRENERAETLRKFRRWNFEETKKDVRLTKDERSSKRVGINFCCLRESV
jgi:hypothetical protein